MKKQLTDEEVEREIREAFELNYVRLRLEGGHALTEDVKKLALQQVLLYWKKLRDIAENVTETEVKLSLPAQKTPKARKFSIEGVVDIVREDDEIWMYDIKTHDAGYVRKHQDLYERQLNVYSHIWKNLRGQPLQHTAIIALSFPGALSEALKTGDPAQIAYQLGQWQPLIHIPFDEKRVEETIRDFGEVVDQIEDYYFSPPPVERLKERVGDQLFVTRYCRNCDARFSCSSYREYVLSSKASQAAFKEYIADLGAEVDVEDWKTSNLEAASLPETVDIAD